MLPEEHYLGDARALGIGGSYLTTSRSSILILSNPARIANISKGISIGQVKPRRKCQAYMGSLQSDTVKLANFWKQIQKR